MAFNQLHVKGNCFMGENAVTSNQPNPDFCLSTLHFRTTRVTLVVGGENKSQLRTRGMATEEIVYWCNGNSVEWNLL